MIPLALTLALAVAPQEKPMTLTPERAAALAELALKGLTQEYPNKPADVLNGDAEVKSPRQVHPAFYGCFDWHSSVHGHWMLVRLLKQFPEMPKAKAIRAALDGNLTAEKLKAEAEYFARPNAKSFERPYGWAWLLKLAEELHTWDDADGKRWATNLKPLTDVIVQRYLDYFPKQTYPIRSGVHSSTAFGLAFAHDYAVTTKHQKLRELVEERAMSYYHLDYGAPARWEPDGADFFSPSLMEADLMRRVLRGDEFRGWLMKYLPNLGRGEPARLLTPATVSDRTDPQIVHLDGLNLSRAWCMKGVAASLPEWDLSRKVMLASAARHAEAGLKHVASGDYAGEHWLASFAVYMLSRP